METLSSNAHPVHNGLIQDVVTFWHWLPLSDVGKMPTPIVRSDVWDRVESYAMCMLLTSRLKIILSSNLKLILFLFGNTTSITLSYQLLSFVASTWHTPLTSHVYLRLAIRPSAEPWEVVWGTPIFNALCIF